MAVTDLRVVCNIITCVSAFTFTELEMAILLLIFLEIIKYAAGLDTLRCRLREGCHCGRLPGFIQDFWLGGEIYRCLNEARKCEGVGASPPPRAPHKNFEDFASLATLDKFTAYAHAPTHFFGVSMHMHR